MTKCKDCAACTVPNRSGFSVCKEFESPYYGFAVVEQSFGCKYGTDFGIGKRKRKNGKERKKLNELERKCRVCGCTSDECCLLVKKTGQPCNWVDYYLCSQSEE